jgi:hypothetical protein
MLARHCDRADSYCCSPQYCWAAVAPAWWSIAIRLHPARHQLVLPATRLTRSTAIRPSLITSSAMKTAKVLTETEIKTVYEQLPKAIGDARLYSGQVSFAEDERTFYWPESVDWEKGRKLPSLEFINSETCTMQLTEVTLVYHGKKMRLVFDINIARSQPDRRLVVDSLPFQEGTFRLDQTGWLGRRDQIVPSEGWKKVKT